MIGRSLIAAILLVPAAPAAVGDQQTPPATPVPVLPPRVGVESAPPLSLTLAEAVKRALDRNPDVTLSRIDTQIAAEGIRVAEGAFDLRLIPALTIQRAVNASASALGGATEGRVEQTLASGSAQIAGRERRAGGRFVIDFSSSRLGTSNQFSRLNPQFPSTFGVTYLQPVLRGRTSDVDRRALLAARSTADRTQAELTHTLMDQVTEVEVAYWELVYAARNLDVQAAALGQAEGQVASNERQADRGTLAPIDVIEAQTQVATFRQAVASAQQALTEAENRLKTLLLPSRSAPEWQQAIVPSRPIDPELPDRGLDEAVRLALARRPELAALNALLAINDADREFFDDQARPQVDLLGSLTFAGLAGGALAETGETIPGFLVGGYGASLTNLFARRFPTAALEVQMELPLGNRTARGNAARASLVAGRIARQRDQLEQLIEADVRNALQAVRSSQTRRDASATASRNALEQYESERRRFESGLSTVFLVLERQASLVAAQAREVRARADLNQSIARFERAVGGTLERHGVTPGRQ